VGPDEVDLRVPGVRRVQVERRTDRFYTDDFREQVSVVMVRVTEKMKLGGRRADDQDLARFGERQREFSEETVRVVRPLLVTVLVGLFAFGMPVDVPVRGLDRFLGEPLGTHLKDACFPMIEPYGRAVECHDQQP
jgi:hypothetical protein